MTAAHPWVCFQAPISYPAAEWQCKEDTEGVVRRKSLSMKVKQSEKEKTQRFGRKDNRLVV
jgi:hypothetical protein